ncbi:MAG: hypothetical protein GKS00_21160 [Alphaproteobacteria bacterium]|nr:hypothetical protein [Alphaproteobacteria bacterium]
MQSTPSKIVIIPYGAPTLDAQRVMVHANDDGSVTVECPTAFVTVGPEMLRLNGDQYTFPETPDLRAMTDTAAQLDFLRNHLKQFCDLWAKPPKLFLDRYFEFVVAKVDENEVRLRETLEQFGSLYAYRDWSLSAPRPLPRAWLPLASGVFCPVDFAFWLGDRALAILLVGSGTATKKEMDRRRALEDAGIEIVELSARALSHEGVDYLARSLPVAFSAFWESEVMPSSPFKGTALGDIVRQ